MHLSMTLALIKFAIKKVHKSIRFQENVCFILSNVAKTKPKRDITRLKAELKFLF